MNNINTVTKAKTARRMLGLLAGLFVASSAAQAACNANIPLTRPDSRYEAVAAATPPGSEVRDKVTGLVWQRCVVGMVWNGTTCTGTASALKWQAALDAARTTTASTAATGRAATWRAPNIAELFSLADRACYDPAINTTWFPTTASDIAWSSSPISVNMAYGVDFTNGFRGTIYIDKGFTENGYSSANNEHRVRLVRSGQ